MAVISALVTGASRGIGREIALQLAARGIRIAIHYRENRAAAEAVLASLPGTGHCVFAAEMGDGDAVERLWSDAQERIGPVGIVVTERLPFMATTRRFRRG